MSLMKAISRDMTISFDLGRYNECGETDPYVTVIITTPENQIEMRTKLVRLAIDRDCEPEITPTDLTAIREIARLLGAVEYLRRKEDDGKGRRQPHAD